MTLQMSLDCRVDTVGLQQWLRLLALGVLAGCAMLWLNRR
jgi:hypothetical protein